MLVIYVSTGVLAIAASVASIRLIAAHLMQFRVPDAQRKIVGILWIVPIYALTSWLSLRYLHASLYLDLVRDTYEAFVLYLFFAFCTSLIAADEQRSTNEMSIEEFAISFEKFLLSEGKDLKWFLSCKRGLAQYVIAKPMSTVLGISLTVCGYGDWYDAIYPYVASILCVSSSIALYWLVAYEMLITFRLQEHNILGKFLSIKIIIFLTFWQGVTLQILQWCGVLHTFRLAFVEFRSYSSATLAEEVQNSLICLEMFFISVVHSWTFSAAPFAATAMETVTPGFGDVMGYRDTFQDLRLLWRLDPQLKTIMNVPGPETGGSDAASAFARGPSLPETTKYLQPDPVQINYQPLKAEEEATAAGSLPPTQQTIDIPPTAPVLNDPGLSATALMSPEKEVGVYPGLRRDGQ